MIPELPIAMLAAARLGVIFTVVFSGFTAQAWLIGSMMRRLSL